MIRIGILGCGRILNAHLQGFQQLRQLGDDDFRITALVARKEEDGHMFRKRGEGPPPRPPLLPPGAVDPLAAPHTYVSDLHDDVVARVYTDYRRLLEDGVVDALLDTTPVFLHHQIGLAALEAGIHLLAQKPLAITMKLARRMVGLARAKKLSLGVFENARYRPLVRAAHWAFASGLLGQPQMALLGSLGGPWSPDRLVADTAWRHIKLQAGGGATLDIGVHQIDVLRHVFGEIRSVQAVARTFEPARGGQPVDVDDTYFATVTFANGAIAQLLWSWGGHGAALALPGTPAFFGSKGCIQFDALTLDGGPRQELLPLFEREADAAFKTRFFPLGLRDPFAIIQHEWLQAIRTGGAGPETDGNEGLRDLAAAFAILESSQAGRPVSLDEILEGKVDAYQRPIDEHFSH
ncbi:MAG: Gfo/Idh/MocA family protein [Gemmataceae bacterium]